VNKLSGLERSAVRFIALAAVLAALAVAFLFSRAQPARADDVTPPPVPANLEVPAGSKLFFVGHAVGTQNYVCLPFADGVRFTLFTPQATLFKPDDSTQVATHYFGPNPDEAGAIRAAWQHSRDTGTVWGRVLPGHSSTDPNYVAPGAIPWLLVTVVGAEAGPDGGDKLTATTHIQRLNTSGGLAPSTGCASSGDIGNQAFVPYETDYYFYK
jgi:hypothetical protein